MASIRILHVLLDISFDHDYLYVMFAAVFLGSALEMSVCELIEDSFDLCAIDYDEMDFEVFSNNS